MKRLISLLCVLLGSLFFFSSCSEKLDNKKCKDLILAHPFLSCKHVGFAKKELPDCKDVFAGTYRERPYYYLHGLDVENVRDLQINGNEAICKFDLLQVDKTSAFPYCNDDRFDGKAIPFQAYFVKYEDSGWKLVRAVTENRLWSINSWGEYGYMSFVNFDYFNE